MKKVKTFKDKYKPKDCVKHNATGNIFEIKSIAISKHSPDTKQYWLVCLNDEQFPSFYSQEENLNAYYTKLNRNSVKILYGY